MLCYGRYVATDKKQPTTGLNQRQQQYNAARQSLLSAGLELFVHKGYAGTKIRDITDAAGVSSGLLFHYVSSKEAILEELVNVIGREFDGIAHLLASKDEPQHILATIADKILGSFADNPSRYMFMLANQVLTLDALPPAVKAVSERSQSVELSVPLIAAGQRTGVFRAGDPEALSVAFWGMLQGIAEMLVWKPRAPIPPSDVIMCVLLAS